jgi:flavin reductase (DIM6/NTAB) family NADH-FMN oxidoreductase RutF
MFYKPAERDRDVLPRDPFKAIIAPRPIGWISAMSAAGAVNLAPYSFFNAVASEPVAILAFSSEGLKDSVTFIQETGEFVWNMPTFDLRDAMNMTGLATAPCVVVKPPRVAASPCALECKLIDVIRLKTVEGTPIDNYLVLGQVVGVHIDEAFITDGRVDTAAMRPIARCGYADYAVADRMFSITRPR